MARNMSFAMTTQQFQDRTKTVTRRFGWWFLNPGDIVMGVEKSMGLKKGEKIKHLGLIRIVSTNRESIFDVTREDCIKEGFPDFYPDDFIDMMSDHYPKRIFRPPLGDMINRIEFKYMEKKDGNR